MLSYEFFHIASLFAKVGSGERMESKDFRIRHWINGLKDYSRISHAHLTLLSYCIQILFEAWLKLLKVISKRPEEFRYCTFKVLIILLFCSCITKMFLRKKKCWTCINFEEENRSESLRANASQKKYIAGIRISF